MKIYDLIYSWKSDGRVLKGDDTVGNNMKFLYCLLEAYEVKSNTFETSRVVYDVCYTFYLRLWHAFINEDVISGITTLSFQGIKKLQIYR